MRDDLLVKMQILSLVFKEYPPQSSQLQSVEFSSFSIKMINKHQCANTCTIAFLEEKKCRATKLSHGGIWGAPPVHVIRWN